MPAVFKNAAFGFNKKDVVDYIEKLVSERDQQLSEKDGRIRELETSVDSLTQFRDEYYDAVGASERLTEELDGAKASLAEMTAARDELETRLTEANDRMAEVAQKARELVEDADRRADARIRELQEQNELHIQELQAQNELHLRELQEQSDARVRELQEENERHHAALEQQYSRQLEEMKAHYQKELDELRAAFDAEKAELQQEMVKLAAEFKTERAQMKNALEVAAMKQEQYDKKLREALAENDSLKKHNVRLLHLTEEAADHVRRAADVQEPMEAVPFKTRLMEIASELSTMAQSVEEPRPGDETAETKEYDILDLFDKPEAPAPEPASEPTPDRKKGLTVGDLLKRIRSVGDILK